MHKLLERQLRKLGAGEHAFDEFLAGVDAAYHQADRDRERVERSLELASRELLERNQQLQADLEHRRQLEAELTQAEKLRAVGQLASGIAHELNTPIQYVSDNVAFLRQAFRVLSPVVEEALRERGEPREVRFVRDNVPDAIEAAREGCARVAEIVSAMKLFAHPDSEEFQLANINRALSCSLAMAQNTVKYAADVELELGELPEVECRIGDLNQVFLNLIINAVHAVVDRYGADGPRGHLRIRSRQSGDKVVVEVADDGCGIPEHAQARVFEPFFTTKQLGRGTGQGLAISHAIVVGKHRGALRFETAAGSGTTFFVELPIRHPSEPPVDSAREPPRASAEPADLGVVPLPSSAAPERSSPVLD